MWMEVVARGHRGKDMRMGQEDRIRSIAKRLNVPAGEVARCLVENKGGETPAAAQNRTWQEARGVSITAHRICRFLIPLLILFAGFPAGVLAARHFRNIENIGTYVAMGGVALSVVSTAFAGLIRVVCPKCYSKVVFRKMKRSAMIQYTCTWCDFRCR